MKWSKNKTQTRKVEKKKRLLAPRIPTGNRKLMTISGFVTVLAAPKKVLPFFHCNIPMKYCRGGKIGKMIVHEGLPGQNVQENKTLENVTGVSRIHGKQSLVASVNKKSYFSSVVNINKH